MRPVHLCLALSILAFLLSGCGDSDSKSVSKNSTTPKPDEKVFYEWVPEGDSMVASRPDAKSAWQIVVDRDAQALKVLNEGFESTCDKFDDSLKQFKDEEPNAQIRELSVNLRLDPDLWSEVLNHVKDRELHVEGTQKTGDDRFPQEIQDDVEQLVRRSKMAKQIIDLGEKHGLNIVNISVTLTCDTDPSVDGREWKKMALMPDGGISRSVFVVFENQTK